MYRIICVFLGFLGCCSKICLNFSDSQREGVSMREQKGGSGRAMVASKVKKHFEYIILQIFNNPFPTRGCDFLGIYEYFILEEFLFFYWPFLIVLFAFQDYQLWNMGHSTKDFSWLGSSWTCKKRRKHYKSFVSNSLKISVSIFLL